MKTAVMTVVRNECDTIAEWLAFHQLQGFDAAIVIDHESDDGTPDVVRRRQHAQDVRLHQIRRDGTTAFQTDPYLWVCRLYAGEFDWICALDADELLVVHGSRLRALLNAQPAKVSMVCVPWAIFGSNGHVVKPTGLMCDSYRFRAESSFEPCRHVKSIVRPAKVQHWLNPHVAHIHGRWTLPDGEPSEWGRLPGILAADPSYDVAQVNHYFVRSRAHWQARMERSGGFQTPRTWEEFAVYDRGEVEDNCAAMWSIAVRRHLEEPLWWKIRGDLALGEAAE